MGQWFIWFYDESPRILSLIRIAMYGEFMIHGGSSWAMVTKATKMGIQKIDCT